MSGFYTIAPQHADRPAIVEPGRTISYGKLYERVNQLSNAILGHGVESGEVLATLLPNCLEVLVVERAALQLPIYLTPINWHLTPPEIAYILRDSAATLLFTASVHLGAALAAADAADLPRDRVIVVDADASVDGARSLPGFVADTSSAPPSGRQAGQRMLYTSGTTGRPKGVRRKLSGSSPETAARAVLDRACLYHTDHPDGVYLSVAPLYHAAPLGYAVQSLDSGHTIVLLPKWEPLAALRAIANHHVTWTYLAPIMMSQLLELDPQVRGAHDVTSVRSIIHTAAPCPVPVKRAIIEWFGPVVNEIYGGTEGGATFVDAADWLDHPGTVGRARPGASIAVLDDEGAPVPAGEIGTVYFSNPGLRFEYFHDPDKTESARRGEFTTLGDVGYLDEDGFLFLRDRAADLIVSGGVNVYPAEIEQVLLNHPVVDDVCVVGVPDEQWGESVHAVVVPSHDTDPTPELAQRIQDWARTDLAGFKVPRHIEFRDRVPRSEVGKLLRRRLRDQVRDSAPPTDPTARRT